ncbi:MAG: CAP domain-containing protein, partial [Terriglobales bacterium]
MLRALVVSFAMLAVFSGIGAAQATPPAGEGPDNVRGEVHSQQPTPNQPPAPKSSSAVGSHSGEDSAAENELLDAINKSRELAGSPALRVEESLREAARMHARRMVASGLLEHRLAGEPSLLERIAAVIAADRAAPDSALKIDRAGENIANASCAPGANDVLMGSAPHRKNRLDRGFNVAGVAAIWSKGRL